MNLLSLNIRGAGDDKKISWVRSLKTQHKVTFICIQETQLADYSKINFHGLWGNSNFDKDGVDASGRSGGLVCLWNPQIFSKIGTVKEQNFIWIHGHLIGEPQILNIINVYAPHDRRAKRGLWDRLEGIVTRNSGLWILAGDFNEVRNMDERLNSDFNSSSADAFNCFINGAGLVEYNMGGYQFTYKTCSLNKFSKIDRVLVSHSFLNLWPYALFKALDRAQLSDHNPLLLACNSIDFGPIPFRFFNSWLNKKDLVDLVYKVIAVSGPFGGHPDVVLSKKLKMIKEEIKKWVRVNKSKEDEKFNLCKAGLDELEKIAESNGGLSEEELRTHSRLKTELGEILDIRKADLKQKSRVRWGCDGDENSHFFHGLFKAHASINRIHGMHFDGYWCNDPIKLKEEAASYFNNRFEEKDIDRPNFIVPAIKQLSDQQRSNLVSRFSLDELKKAVWDCGADKSPGPDGFTFGFVKKFWDLLQNDFKAMTDRFFVHGRISKGCASSFISLIPKCPDPQSFDDYRPITLIGCIYKVISKLLANRLQKEIGSVISDNQSAFIAGRQILDGPLVLSEVISWLKLSKKSAYLLKIDMEKAFDCVNWKYLIETMRQMNFPIRWCKWIETCLKSSRSSVLINGSPSAEFNCSRGLRQGDPLSPFLFAIAMEPLTCFLNKAIDVGLIQGIHLPNGGPNINHLLYADDVLMIGEWSNRSLLNIVRIMRCFGLISGLKMNVHKSMLLGMGTATSESDRVALAMGLKSGSFPLTYLGFPLGANMNLCRHWHPVIENFKKRLSKWKAKTLSIGGRMTLLQSVLSSLPLYFFSLFKAPVGIIDQLERIRRRFFWAGKDDGNCINWVAWGDVIAAKNHGGTGLGSLKGANIALL